MAKKKASPEEKEKALEQIKPGVELPKLSPEQEVVMKKIKPELEKFQEHILKARKDITGMSILPPLKPRPGETLNPDEVHIFILLDDADLDRKQKGDLIISSTDQCTKIAKEIDPNLKPQVMLISELKEACFDAKHDIVSMVATSAVFYDKGLLSAVKVAEYHKNMSIKKFEKYVISYIAVGSLFRGDAAPNDIDVAIIIDDTDVKKMSRLELRDKLRTIILNMGYDAGQRTGVRAQFHIQTYILTDFWENVKDANPVIFTMLRDGVPLYDRGVFMPWKLLLQMGRIKPSPEAIDMNMEVGDRLLKRTQQKLLSVLADDIFYAVMNPTQAALMLYGIPPPTPKEAVKLMDEIYVKKEKILEKKYILILENIRKTFKDIEHGDLKEVSGKDVDKLLKDCKDYLDRIKKLFEEIEERQEKETIVDIYTTSMNLVRDLLQELGVKDIIAAKLPALYKKHICDGERIPLKYHKMFQDIIKAKKDYDNNKLTKQELNKVRRNTREFIRVTVNLLDRKRAVKLDRNRISFTYGKKGAGEMLFLEKIIFITKDVMKQEDMHTATLGKDGKLENIKPSNLGEYENYIKKTKVLGLVAVKPTTLISLEKLMGEEITILWKA